MVKGVARHAVIVKAPETKEFEQAIFIISGQSEELVKNPDEMLELANRLAEKYCIASKNKKNVLKKYFLPMLWFACGSGVTALIWLYISNMPL